MVFYCSSVRICLCTSVLMQGQQTPQYLVDHSDCLYFGAQHEKFAHTGLNETAQRYRLSKMTAAVASALPARESRVAPDATAQPVSSNIAKYLFAALNHPALTPPAP